ncbi:aldose 1-epimerase family protein [Aureibaculum sp. 2210JD6-5]|uniref:aldose 1-epimerase family protein n=1 Tax=Aureibaculum sp. 2210JD6-5 TaxID=3103957 RepID=UPI002AAE4ED9|nr:aldose 1-epimerase family protein [Aureibaculum sp. 2210JD6-5]MDY7396808.1 aldose 1-epimerase family protein [Aureibaculum sp. 2210JD6-5]
MNNLINSILKNTTYLMFTLMFLTSCNFNKKSKPLLANNEMKTDKNIQTEYVLKNKFLTLVVKAKGAEMTSLRTENREYVWQADPEFWPRHAPILFPIVGRLVDHEYTYNGKTYAMKQHGFARDNDFKMIDRTENSITFEQVATEKSKEIYPFDFVLQVKYTLSEKSLITKYVVKNPLENEDLYFSIGAHPAFNCPFEEGQARNEYELIFDKALAPESEDKTKGLRINKTNKVFEEKGKITLHDSIFNNDALIFNPNPFSKVTFVHKLTQKKYLSISFKNYPYLGIWSPNETSPFVCIEPWHGITDSEDHNKELKEKEGIIKLMPNNTFNCEFIVEVL